MGQRATWSSQWVELVLLRQPIGTVRRTSVSSSEAPGYGPIGHSRNTRRNCSGETGNPHSDTTPFENSSAVHRPLSKRRTQGLVSHRFHTSSSLAIPASSAIDPTPPSSMSTPPRSNSTRSTSRPVIQANVVPQRDKLTADAHGRAVVQAGASAVTFAPTIDPRRQPVDVVSPPTSARSGHEHRGDPARARLGGARRHVAARRHLLDGAGGGAVGPAGPERLGQDHAAQGGRIGTVADQGSSRDPG